MRRSTPRPRSSGERRTMGAGRAGAARRPDEPPQAARRARRRRRWRPQPGTLVLPASPRPGRGRRTTAPRPSQAVLLFGEDPGAPTPWSAYLDRGAATLVDPDSPAAAALVGAAVLDALPAEARLAASRRLPAVPCQCPSCTELHAHARRSPAGQQCEMYR